MWVVNLFLTHIWLSRKEINCPQITSLTNPITTWIVSSFMTVKGWAEHDSKNNNNKKKQKKNENGSATENVRFSFRSSGRTKSFQKARLGGMGFSVTNFDHTKRVSVDSWKTRTYGLRISKWKAGVRSFLIRNHLFPLDVIKPSPVKKKTEIFVPHNKDAR